MTSEVTSDLKIQLSDLDYICFHVSLASKGLHEINDTDGRTEEVYDPLTCVASPQVKIERDPSFIQHKEYINFLH